MSVTEQMIREIKYLKKDRQLLVEQMTSLTEENDRLRERCCHIDQTQPGGCMTQDEENNKEIDRLKLRIADAAKDFANATGLRVSYAHIEYSHLREVAKGRRHLFDSKHCY